MPEQTKSLGDELWKSRVEKISGELFALTYGALVAQLIKETSKDNMEEVNQSLETIGYRIGTKLVEEFLSKTNLNRCPDFKETAEIISKVSTTSY
jgi:FlaA1/EpsC-like NDP-sugar epimerase